MLSSLQPGSYALIPSTFEAGVAADFNLRVHASFAIGAKLLPQEDAGRFTKLIRGKWTETSAGGGPRSTSYRTNPTYRFVVASACLFRCVDFAPVFFGTAQNAEEQTCTQSAPSAGSASARCPHERDNLCCRAKCRWWRSTRSGSRQQRSLFDFRCGLCHTRDPLEAIYSRLLDHTFDLLTRRAGFLHPYCAIRSPHLARVVVAGGKLSNSASKKGNALLRTHNIAYGGSAV